MTKLEQILHGAAEVSKRAWDEYGHDIQFTVLMEECAELIQAISKFKRQWQKDIESPHNCMSIEMLEAANNLMEELADVALVLMGAAQWMGTDKFFKHLEIKTWQLHDKLKHADKSIVERIAESAKNLANINRDLTKKPVDI